MVHDRFTAIDVETANPDMESICQIGLVRYENGVTVDEWVQLIDPEDFFDEVNVGIHGIRESDVQGMPKLPEVQEKIRSFLEDTVAVCHTHFDRLSINKAFSKYSLPPVATQWLDSARVARRTWADCAYSGYGLEPLSRKLGFTFRHHDALEDAKAAGHVLLMAISESGLSIGDWLARVNHPISVSSGSSQPVKRDGNPDGDLQGEILVFTGALSMPRQDAANLAANVGCDVANGVTKKTTILVVGDQDIRTLAGHEKSSKHRKAEELIQKGHLIRIIGETDFLTLVGLSVS